MPTFGIGVGEGPTEDEGIYVAAFKKLPEQTPGTIRFFDKNGDGEGFVVYNADAQLTAKEIFQTNAAIRTCKYKDGGEEKKLEYAYIKRSNFEVFVRDLLLRLQYRVEVYVNESKGKSRIEWVSKYKASPGNLAQFEDILFANNEMTVNNGVMGIKVGVADKAKTVGIAHVNLNECEIHLIEFADNETLTNLESVLVQLSPKEAVIPASASQNEDLSTLRRILERNRVLVNEQRISDFDSKDVEQDMVKILKFQKGKIQKVSALPDFGKKVAVSALAGVIKYLDLLSGEARQNQFSLKPYDFGLYVKLDAAAARALHLSLNVLERKSRNDISLLGTIDKCRTAQGHRLIAQYLKQPLLSKERLEERFDLVQILVEDVVLRQSLRDDHLRRIPDCQVVARKLLRKKASLQDVYRAYVFITKMGKMLDDLKSHESSKQHVLQSYFIDPLSALYEEVSKFQGLVETTMDLDMAGKGEYVVKADFDDSLKDIKKGMNNVESKMAKLLLKVASELGLEANKNVKLESNGQHGYFFRVTMKDEKSIRHAKGYEIIRSAKGAVGFRNSELEYLSTEYSELRTKYENEQKDIVAEMANVAAEYHTSFEQIGRIVAELDVYTSFAYVSANSPAPFVRPKLLPRGSGKIYFEGLRHPCLETLPNVNYIPNDVDFEKGRQSFYIVTGPNMGGKSTFLRSVGIATLLAHVGCFVPATSAIVSVVDAILARVGASDSLIKGVSTFMAEMIETSYILKAGTSDSLVLIDELGRGTSTYDGFGLCWAISKYLAQNMDCYSVLATHFHELTALADEIPTVANYHVTAVAGQDGLTMLYKIEKGPCDRSFGIHVANYVGFPEDVLKEAKEMAKLLEDYCQEDDADDSVAAVQRRKENKLAGQQIIDDFILNVKQACLTLKEELESGSITQEVADSQIQDTVQRLLVGVKENGSSNPYLDHILRQSLSLSSADLLQDNNLVSTESTEWYNK